MNEVIVFILFALGLVLILKGGDMFVDAASNAASMLGVPKFIIGATIVSFATTMPEMMVSVMAAFDGRLDMAVGNAIGSVTANTGLIMALSAVFMPSDLNRRLYAPKSCMLICAVLCLWLICAKGTLSAKNSLVLLFIILIYIMENIDSGRKNISSENGYISKKGLFKETVYFLIGAAAVIMGSRLLVDNGSAIARLFNVPENVIAVTMVALGTSLPELVTAITAIAKKEAALTAGNIIGANIIDTALILPVCAIIRGGKMAIDTHTVFLDIPVCILIVCFNLIPMLITGERKRSLGIISILIYIAYVLITCFASPFA